MGPGLLTSGPPLHISRVGHTPMRNRRTYGKFSHPESSFYLFSDSPLDTVFVVYSISFTCSFNLLSSFPVEQTWAGLQRMPTWREKLSFLGIFLDCHPRYKFVISFQDLLLVSTFSLLHFLLTFGESHCKGQNAIITQKHTTCNLGKPKR